MRSLSNFYIIKEEQIADGIKLHLKPDVIQWFDVAEKIALEQKDDLFPFKLYEVLSIDRQTDIMELGFLCYYQPSYYVAPYINIEIYEILKKAAKNEN